MIVQPAALADRHIPLVLDSLTNNEAIRSGPGNPNMTVINEAGLYRLIFTSRKADAETFKTWVVSEVIPSIRKHSGYMIARPDETPEELAIRALCDRSGRRNFKGQICLLPAPTIAAVLRVIAAGLHAMPLLAAATPPARAKQAGIGNADISLFGQRPPRRPPGPDRRRLNNRPASSPPLPRWHGHRPTPRPHPPGLPPPSLSPLV